MYLIADGGSTKTEWILIEEQQVVMRFLTKGFNPNYTDWETITAIIDTEFPSDCPGDVEKINYYGSGCGNEKNCQLVSSALQRRFPAAEIHVSHDLMAAAHGLWGTKKELRAFWVRVPILVCMMGKILSIRPFRWAFSSVMRVVALILEKNLAELFLWLHACGLETGV